MSKRSKHILITLFTFILGLGYGFFSEIESSKSGSMVFASSNIPFAPEIIEATFNDGGECGYCRYAFIRLKLPVIPSDFGKYLEFHYARLGETKFACTWYFE